ncbi:tetratricopeptide repeat protein [bacterium]|nr:tetratricopeptide repeat protein [bacterium]
MMSLWKSIKWIIKIIIGVILLGLILEIAGNYISKWLEGKESEIFGKFVMLLESYWINISIILFLIFLIWVLIWVNVRKNEFRKIWELYKPVNNLTPEDFKIQKYKDVRISRENDTSIENLLKDGKHILITGKPKMGKTRSAYEEIKKIKNFSVIKPKPEMIEAEKIKIPPLEKKNFILFFDDIERFLDKNIDYVIDSLKKKSKKLIVVATCRSGEELALFKDENLPLWREFTNIELEEISEKEGETLAKDAGLQWKPEQFDGTPGSVILDLEDMKNRYKTAGDGKVILKTLKLLKEGNLFFYREFLVKEVCEDVFELSVEKLKRHEWDEIITKLKEKGFVTKDGKIIYIYPSYLDTCVYDYNPSQADLMKLKDILIRTKDSGSLFYLGNRFYYKEDFSHAKGCYSEALRIYPRYASAHSSLGYVLTKLGETEEAKGRYDKAEGLYKEAEKEHREAIRINPHYAVDYNNLGYVLTRLGELRGEDGEAKKLYEEAEKEHRKAIKLKPDYPSAHRSLAYALGRLGRNEEAENEYREAIKLNPEFPFAHNLLGHLLAQLGRNEEAEKEYREAIRIKPDYPSARNNFGCLLKKMGRHKDAEKEYREAIKVSSDYIVAYRNLGDLLSDLGKSGAAEKEYRNALQINPNYAEAYNGLGYILVNLKRYDEAEKEYRKALQIDPYYENALLCLGVLLDRSNKKEAEDCYKKVIEKNPNNIKARATYAYFLLYRGREDEAKREFGEVVKIDPNDARALIKLGRFDEAERAIIEAIRLDPNNAFAHKTLGILQEERGDRAQSKEDKLRLYKEAEKEYKKSLELNTRSPSAHRHLANTLEKSGRYEEAENKYKETKMIADNYPKNNRDFGIFLSKIGRKEEAKKELGLAIKLFKKQGNKKEAEKLEELVKNL